MTRIALLVVSLAAATAHAEPVVEPIGGPEVVAAKVAASVVRLANYENGEETGHGSGFFVADGIVVTNHHVIAEASNMMAVLPDGKRLRVLGKLADDESHDLALLRVEGTAPPLVLASELHVGQRAIAIGSPLGFDQTVSAGIVSAVRDGYPPEIVKREPDLAKSKGLLVQHTASIAPGSSGGPLVDDAGHVIGANHSHYPGTEINFAAHVDVLRALIQKTNLQAKPDPLGPNVRRNLAISGAVVGVIVLAWLITAWVTRKRRS